MLVDSSADKSIAQGSISLSYIVAQGDGIGANRSSDAEKPDLARETRGNRVVRIGQFEADPDGRARGVVHPVDDGDMSDITSADLRIDLALHACPNFAKLADRHVHFDIKRVDLR